jgi:hypothetical protein
VRVGGCGGWVAGGVDRDIVSSSSHDMHVSSSSYDAGGVDRDIGDINA